jgi:hypothetical protein
MWARRAGDADTILSHALELAEAMLAEAMASRVIISTAVH